MDYQAILEEIAETVKKHPKKGNVATYIPALAKVPDDKLGIALVTIDGKTFSYGDAEEKFSVQSIAKVFSLVLAFSKIGEALWQRLGIEPSGNPFNSLVQLEYEKGIPRNPFINAGALVVDDVLMALFPDAKAELLAFIRKLAGNTNISYDKEVASSEWDTGYTNAALAYFLKSHQNMRHKVIDVLDVYFHQCSVAMTCKELATAFLLLANHGVIPATGERILTKSQAKRLNAVMLTCGFYDEAGEFAFRVGLPGKSGVGGGIVAVYPGEWSIAVWSPSLNDHGNSELGIQVLEMFTTLTEKSIF
ncbi:MAG TPA: glutaminase [Saprospiraceae bacterium]|nr:glutaminase [Saprospiraceae bacterium]HMQ81968.1 glutaminase [Saprospiraceae bacterium]